jgi:peptidoglycan/xylan/chitin deacetylase (PgdA/CDA1 family)
MQGEAPTGSYRRATRRAEVRRRRFIAIGAIGVIAAGLGVALLARGSSSHASARPPLVIEPLATTAAATFPPPKPGTGKVVFNGPESGNRVALTFDDGSCAACIAAVLAELERTKTPATLFPNGAYAQFWEPNAGEVRKLVASGLVDLGNHTWSHNDVRTQSAAVLKDELQRNEEWMQINFGGSSYPLFRPPFGTYNSAAVRRAGKWGWTTTVTWSAGSRDWEGLSADAIVAELKTSVKPGAIILLHPNYRTTVAALPRIIADIQAKVLQPVTLRALLGM